MNTLPANSEVAIIGAGFSGICTAIRLQLAGIRDFVMIERQSDLGGVWTQNTYPGAACDVASALYSFSFENDYDWPRTHGSWRDIVTYMKHCIRKYGVGDRLCLDTGVVRAEWQEAAGRWGIETTRGTIHARYVVSATGLFSKPIIPPTPGLDGFGGVALHSAQWDHDFDPARKTIAIVGNGCSAAQIVPAIVDQAKHILLVMRSPVHVITKAERTYSAEERGLYAKFPVLRELDRQGFIRKSLELADLPVSEASRERANPAILESMRQQIKTPTKREAVLPDYPVMGKRPIRSDDYLVALDRDHVDVLRTTIDHLTKDAMVLRDGRSFPIDAIVFATGFEASEYLVPLEVIGRNSLRLHDLWVEGAHAHLGMLVPGFPNFLMIYGPNSNVVGSILQIIEPHVEAAVKLIGLSREQDAEIEVDAHEEAAFNREIQDRLARTVWGLAATSSYFTAKTGRIVTQWPGTFIEFQERLAAVDWSTMLRHRNAEDRLRDGDLAGIALAS